MNSAPTVYNLVEENEAFGTLEEVLYRWQAPWYFISLTCHQLKNMSLFHVSLMKKNAALNYEMVLRNHQLQETSWFQKF